MASQPFPATLFQGGTVLPLKALYLVYRPGHNFSEVLIWGMVMVPAHVQVRGDADGDQLRR